MSDSSRTRGVIESDEHPAPNFVSGATAAAEAGPAGSVGSAAPGNVFFVVNGDGARRRPRLDSYRSTEANLAQKGGN